MEPSNAALERVRSTARHENRLRTEYRLLATHRRGEHTIAIVGGGPLVAEQRSRAVPFSGRRRPRIRRRLSWLHVLTAAAVAVLAFAFVNPVGVYAPALRAAVETMVTSMALTAAWLLQAQFMRTRRVRDLLLFGAVLTLAAIELAACCVPAALNISLGGHFGVVELCGRLSAAVAFAAAALMSPGRLIGRGRRPVALVAAISLAAAGISELLSLVLGRALIASAGRSLPGVQEALRHPLAVILALGTAGLFAYSAYGLRGADRRERRSVAATRSGIALLAGAAILLAATAMYYLPLPLISPDSISPREGLRLLAFTLVLASVFQHELAMRAGIARAAAAAERRRVAQDLHDSLAQDLALIAAHSPLMATEFGREHPVVVAAHRALAVSRGTISYLSDPGATTTIEALEALAGELRARFEISLTVDGGLEDEPAPYVREDLCRIAREAIANGVRHGGADHVIVSLRQTSNGIRLRVSDNGCGIGVRDIVGDGFGLASMRERAAAIGGQLSVKQSGRRGTELEVTIP